ncbi:PadR family transcriptional regulator [Microbacterium resistens]|uniref:PadR family transcriptional regulator n=1 Tax=Microbacterium resistens TaxID=156977 RepID=UPI001C56EB79|nr:PadR family transcriptional regulator [Microbacterium resistens]MBW1637529.1 PadR family transcriptional regulator [Microbacterium resistens]
MVDQTPTGSTILGYLALHPRSGYGIRRAAARTPFWGLSDGQLYPQLRKLELEGLIAPVGAVDARGKQVWRLLDAGRRALGLWLRAPSQPVAIRDENMVKLMFAARVDKVAAAALIAERRRHFTSFREHLASLSPGETWSEEERRSAAGIPDLLKDYGVEYCDLNLAWCDRLEDALGVEEKR